jgi:hypothetical protein
MCRGFIEWSVRLSFLKDQIWLIGIYLGSGMVNIFEKNYNPERAIIQKNYGIV